MRMLLQVAGALLRAVAIIPKFTHSSVFLKLAAGSGSDAE